MARAGRIALPRAMADDALGSPSGVLLERQSQDRAQGNMRKAAEMARKAKGSAPSKGFPAQRFISAGEGPMCEPVEIICASPDANGLGNDRRFDLHQFVRHVDQCRKIVRSRCNAGRGLMLVPDSATARRLRKSSPQENGPKAQFSILVSENALIPSADASQIFGPPEHAAACHILLVAKPPHEGVRMILIVWNPIVVISPFPAPLHIRAQSKIGTAAFHMFR